MLLAGGDINTPLHINLLHVQLSGEGMTICATIHSPTPFTFHVNTIGVGGPLVIHTVSSLQILFYSHSMLWLLLSFVIHLRRPSIPPPFSYFECLLLMPPPPPPYLMQLFERLLLMAGGRIVYFGNNSDPCVDYLFSSGEAKTHSRLVLHIHLLSLGMGTLNTAKSSRPLFSECLSG